MSKNKFAWRATVDKIEERIARRYVSGSGHEAIFENESEGWYVSLKGSTLSLYVGHEKPDWQSGDRLKITAQKVDDGK